jgi:hypothetical protein
MNRLRLPLIAVALVCLGPLARAQAFDAELAKKLGADERGMRMYVLCILKTGPKDAEIKGDERRRSSPATSRTSSASPTKESWPRPARSERTTRTTAASTSSTPRRSKTRRSSYSSIRR